MGRWPPTQQGTGAAFTTSPGTVEPDEVARAALWTLGAGRRPPAGTR
jgi:hypothetical protein